MEIDWTSVLTALITALGAGGGISAVTMRKVNKRAKNVESEVSLGAGWERLSEEKSEGLKYKDGIIEQKDAKITELYHQMREDRKSAEDEIDRLRGELDKANTKVAVLSIYKCNKVGCGERQPPFGSVRLPQIDE